MLPGRLGIEEGIIAQLADAFQCHVSGALDGPLTVLLHKDSADEVSDGGLVGEDADDLLGAALDLAVQALERIGGVQLRPVLGGEGHIGEYILLGLVHEGGELRDLGAKLVGDAAPLLAGGLSRLLGEGGGDEGGDDAPTA